MIKYYVDLELDAKESLKHEHNDSHIDDDLKDYEFKNFEYGSEEANKIEDAFRELKASREFLTFDEVVQLANDFKEKLNLNFIKIRKYNQYEDSAVWFMYDYNGSVLVLSAMPSIDWKKVCSEFTSKITKEPSSPDDFDINKRYMVDDSDFLNVYEDSIDN